MTEDENEALLRFIGLDRPFAVEPLKSAVDFLKDVPTGTTGNLAEWLMIAARSIVDENGLRVISALGRETPVANTPLASEHSIAWQLARMMELTGLVERD